MSNLIYGPSYISLEYALGYHGLIPERVSTVTSVALGRSRTFETPLGTFTYQSLLLPSYVVGADSVESPVGCFLIACAEKALADSMLNRYDCQTRDHYVNALREILQELALLGLWRGKFFEHASAGSGRAG